MSLREKAYEVMGAFLEKKPDVPGSSKKEAQGKNRKPSLDDWDRKWISLGPLLKAELTPYGSYVGIYRHRCKGEIVYIGRAIELHNGGFRKRLRDYMRPSDSGRKHSSGRMIYEHLPEISTDIILVGKDAEAVALTKELETHLIHKYRPKWNRQFG